MSDPTLPGIPYPKPEPASLFATVLAMKNVVETMGGLRGGDKSRSARYEELELIGAKASTTDVLEGTNQSRNVTPDALAALWELGAIVNPAATLTLGDGGYFTVTGTPASITNIDFAVSKNGRMAWLYFASAAAGTVLVHNASTLILPGSANITVAGGDAALFVQHVGDTVRCLNYLRQDGVLLPAGLASTTEVLTGTDITKAVTPDALAALWEATGGLTNAPTFVLGEGGYFSVPNGTPQTITSITFANSKDGRAGWMRWGTSSAGSTLVESANLSLPGAANITIRDGDLGLFMQISATLTRCMVFTRRDGTTIVYSSPTIVKTADYTLTPADYGKTFLCDATAGPITITLPTCASLGNGFQFAVNKIDSSANTVTVDPAGAEVIDTATATSVMDTRWRAREFITDGVQWYQTTGSSGAATNRYGVVQLASTTDVLTGTDTTDVVTPDALAALWEIGPDPGNSASIALGEGGYFPIQTGAPVAITTISFVTQKNGRQAWIRWGASAAGSVLTNSATLVLPGAANIITRNGDVGLFMQISATITRCMIYVRADGTVLVNELVGLNATSYTDLNLVPDGFQHFKAGSPFTNAPSGTNWTGIQVGWAGTRKVQIVWTTGTGTSAPQMSMREQDSTNAWTAWFELATLAHPVFSGTFTSTVTANAFVTQKFILADDTVGYISSVINGGNNELWSINEYGGGGLGINQGRPHGLFRVRNGDPNAQPVAMEADTGVLFGQGALVPTGTTLTDTKFNIYNSGSGATSGLYVENRTGGTRTVNLTRLG